MGFGRELLAWPGIRSHTGERRLFLNGATLHLDTVNLAEPVDVVLDRFQQECAARGGLKAESGLLEKLGMNPDGVFRQESADGGVVACFDMGLPRDPDEVLERVERFTQSGDLAEMGAMRFAYVQEGERGTSALVHVERSKPSASQNVPEDWGCPWS